MAQSCWGLSAGESCWCCREVSGDAPRVPLGAHGPAVTGSSETPFGVDIYIIWEAGKLSAGVSDTILLRSAAQTLHGLGSRAQVPGTGRRSWVSISSIS